MFVPMGFWGKAVKKGAPVSLSIDGPEIVVITAASLGSKAGKERHVLSCEVEGSKFVLCSLTLGVCEQAPLNIKLRGEEIKFLLEAGSGEVHLTGYSEAYVDPEDDDDDEMDGYDDDEENDLDDEVLINTMMNQAMTTGKSSAALKRKMGAASEGSNKRRKTNDDSDSDDDSDDEEVGGKAGDLAQIIDKNFFQTDAASEDDEDSDYEEADEAEEDDDDSEDEMNAKHVAFGSSSDEAEEDDDDSEDEMNAKHVAFGSSSDDDSEEEDDSEDEDVQEEAPKKHKPHENSKVQREQTPAKPAKKQDNGATPKSLAKNQHKKYLAAAAARGTPQTAAKAKPFKCTHGGCTKSFATEEGDGSS